MILELLGSASHPKAFRQFLAGAGRRDLQAWLLEAYSDLRDGGPIDPLYLRNRLVYGIHRDGKVLDAVAKALLLAQIVEVVAPAYPALALAVLLLEFVPIGTEWVENLGATPVGKVQPAWPFLFALGRNPNVTEIEAIRQRLKKL